MASDDYPEREPHTDGDQDADTLVDWEDYWRTLIGELVTANVREFCTLEDHNEWAVRQLGELLIAADSHSDIGTDEALSRLTKMLANGQDVGLAADMVVALCRLLAAAFAGGGLPFELALDEMSEALETIAARQSAQSAKQVSPTGTMRF